MKTPQELAKELAEYMTKEQLESEIECYEGINWRKLREDEQVLLEAYKERLEEL